MGCLLLTKTDLWNLTNPSATLVEAVHLFPWAQWGPGNYTQLADDKPVLVCRGLKNNSLHRPWGQTCLPGSKAFRFLLISLSLSDGHHPE